METEFMISDLAIIEKKIPLLQKELKAKPSADKELELKTLMKCKEALDNNLPIRTVEFNKDEAKSINGYQFLCKKPIFITANLNEEQMVSSMPKDIEAAAAKKGLKSISICAAVEAEIKDLDESERMTFAKEMGVTELCADKVINMAREIMGLMVFFTGSYKGEEVRAWPVPIGSTAPEAAGKIHSDFFRGFIRAEVVSYNDFVQCGSFAEAKAKGLMRLEGKEYIVKDGDIITFHFNV